MFFSNSMRFQNPAYGIERSESFSSGREVRPGQHEYTNPVHINTQDMQAAANVILQRAKQNPFTDADSAPVKENYDGSKLIKF